MCGISGLFLKDGETASKDQLLAMAEAMRRRGPDAQGVFVQGPVGLAHRRLSVIDLSATANQPMLNDEKDVAVAYNGEIYNFTELREELIRSGYRFKTRSDTEVVLHAYQEWGEECFARFNGMFACAIWDRRDSAPVVYVARDRFGIKPLFFTDQGGRFAFASELKPLLALPWVGRELDLESVFHFLRFSHVPTPKSIFRKVRQLYPGTWIRFCHGRLTTGTFHDPLDLVRASEEKGRTEESWLEELDRVLRDSVYRQLMSDVPLGCFLSGGVDSSLLTIAAQDLTGGKTETFSIGYQEKEFDESGYARMIAEAFGTRHHEIVACPSDYRDLIPEVPELFDQPFADPTLLSSLLLARFSRQHVTVALSGDGADELFYGYPYQKALLHLPRLGFLPSRLRARLFGSVTSAITRLAENGVKGKVGWQLRKAADILQFGSEAELFESFIGMIGPLPTPKVASLMRGSRPLLENAAHAHADVFKAAQKLPPEKKVLEVFVRTFLVDTVLAKTDRATMAYGLEARVPFLDDRMVDFATRLPFELKLRGGTSKYLLRRLFEKKLAEKGLPVAPSRRPKQGFSIPLREWLRGDLKYLLDEYLAGARIRREGVFDAKGVSLLVQEHLDSRANHSHLLWSLVCFQMWKERYLPGAVT